MAELVSVIIPTFNRCLLLSKCLDSVFAQNYRPLEIIVVDDGSSDDTLEFLQGSAAEFARKHDVRFQFIAQENRGAPTARNEGLFRASGTYVNFLDSDDTLLPGKIKMCMEYSLTHSADIVYSKAQYIDDLGKRLNRYWGRPLDGSALDYFTLSWQTMCALYSRNALRTIGNWNESLSAWQDLEFCIRAVTSGLRIHFIDEVLAEYRIHNDGRIGDMAELKAATGRERTTWTIVQHLQNQKIFGGHLKFRYAKRLMYFGMIYRKHGSVNELETLSQKMAEFNLMPRGVIRLFFHLFRPALCSAVLRRQEQKRARIC